MTFLLDTVALSQMTKSRPNRGFMTWFEAVDPVDLFVSVVTIGEIEFGIEQQRSALPDFARRLEIWCSRIVATYDERMLPVTVEVARAWGRLSHRKGHATADLLIAATALVHDLTVVTRNVRHFDGTGAKILNPFEG